MSKKRHVSQQLIQSYGLFWSVNAVFWGAGGSSNRGALWGWGNRRDKSNGIVNFRNQIGVYVLYDGYRPIYAGQAGFGDQKQNLFDRLRQHRKDDLANRWDHFSWFGTRWVTGVGKLSAPAANTHPTAEVVLNQLEAILITAIEPGSNRQGGKWGKAKRYDQKRDPRLGLTQEEMLRVLLKQQNIEKKGELPDDWNKLLE